jgi:molybdenum cofactor biosynthesis enzyme MoaA
MMFAIFHLLSKRKCSGLPINSPALPDGKDRCPLGCEGLKRQEMKRLPVVQLAPIAAERESPCVALSALDTVWFQLTGTVCNLACLHCFISCGPEEERVPLMEKAEVERYLDEAEALGVRDYYFTGGEPMLHPDFWPLVERTLQQGALTVLTNGLFLDESAAATASELFHRARYSFDLRVSLDGMSPEENDPVRGRGTFERIVEGLRQLGRAGLSPSITVVEHRQEMADEAARVGFLAFARSLGLRHPRVKFLPLLRIGREERRTRSYDDDEFEALRSGSALRPEVEEALGCSNSRLVAADGVRTCPILLDAPSALLGRTLRESMRPISLRFSACRTCVVDGLSCRT